MLPQCFHKGHIHLQSDHRESQDAKTSEQTQNHHGDWSSSSTTNTEQSRATSAPLSVQHYLTGSRPRFIWTRVQQRLAGSNRVKSQLFLYVAPAEAHICPICASTEDECLQTLQISQKLWKTRNQSQKSSKLQRKPSEEGSSVS